MSGLSWGPVDSTEARERREAAQEHADQATAAWEPPEAEHDPRCSDGWLGLDDDERPIPCPTCRSHLRAAPCRVCGVQQEACRDQWLRGRGRCCDTGCDHATRLTRRGNESPFINAPKEEA